MPKNIIVSNRLPVQAQKTDETWSFTPTSGGLATGMKSVHQEGDSLWVGWPGVSSDGLDEKNKNPDVPLRQDPKDALPRGNDYQ